MHHNFRWLSTYLRHDFSVTEPVYEEIGHFFAPSVGIEDAKCDLGRYDFPNPYRLKGVVWGLRYAFGRYEIFRGTEATKMISWGLLLR
jgi:hypothetical protein